MNKDKEKAKGRIGDWVRVKSKLCFHLDSPGVSSNKTQEIKRQSITRTPHWSSGREASYRGTSKSRRRNCIKKWIRTSYTNLVTDSKQRVRS